MLTNIYMLAFIIINNESSKSYTNTIIMKKLKLHHKIKSLLEFTVNRESQYYKNV